ncbi:MAG TPA: SRPBCC family protein [Verrucomicrobiae bacterium]|nr:SRPBCC family protein [Verrucomicrobiae bacterium]
MPEIKATTVVPVAQSVVFDFVGDSRNAPRWVFGVHRVEPGAPHPLRPGDHVTFQLGAAGQRLESRWRIDEWTPPTHVTSSGHALGARAQLRIECRALGPEATEVVEVLRYQLPGGVLGMVADRLGIHGILEMQARNSMRALRRLLTPPAPGRAGAQDRRAEARAAAGGAARERPAAGGGTDGG